MPVPRAIIASLVAPICALAPLLLLGAWEATQPVRIIGGEPDDAPMRSFGLVLVALPIIYVVMSVAAYAIGCTLRRVGLRSMRSFLCASAAIALALAVVVGLSASDPQRFGVQDSLIAVAALSSMFLLSIMPSAACWWYITRSDA